MSNPLRHSSEGEGTAPARWSAGGLSARLAVAIALPALVGGLVASFIPWPEWQWPGFAIAAFVTALGAWLWLEATALRRLERIARALEPGGDAPAPTPGGGLSALVETVVAARIRERELERGAERLELVRLGLADLSANAGEWAETERAPAFDPAHAPEELAPLVVRLALAAQRLEERSDAARAVAAQVKETVSDAGARTSGLAAAAEREFVEAASLLTVLGGLERAGGDLAQGLAALAPLLAGWSADARAGRAASEELERAASEQDGELAAADERVRAARRAIARVLEAARIAAVESAHAALAAGDLPGEDRARLTDALAELLRSTHAAGESANAIDVPRPRATSRAAADRAPATPVPATSDPTLVSRRALERVLEVVQEAITRAEKLVQQAERTSSEAQRAGGGVAAAVDEVDGLLARFDCGPPALVEVTLESPPADAPIDGADADEGPQRPLRVLGPEDLLPDDENWSHG